MWTFQRYTAGLHYFLAGQVLSYENTDFDEIVSKVVETHTPVCVSADGLSVIDEVGGIEGYVDFLERVFVDPKKIKTEDTEEGDTEIEASYLLMWAKEHGWKTKVVPPHKML